MWVSFIYFSPSLFLGLPIDSAGIIKRRFYFIFFLCSRAHEFCLVWEGSDEKLKKGRTQARKKKTLLHFIGSEAIRTGRHLSLSLTGARDFSVGRRGWKERERRSGPAHLASAADAQRFFRLDLHDLRPGNHNPKWEESGRGGFSKN